MSLRYTRVVVWAAERAQRWDCMPPVSLTRAERRAHKRRLRMLIWAQRRADDAA